MSNTPTRLVLVYGAGGHGQVVSDALWAGGRDVATVFDDDASKWGSQLQGVLIEPYDLNRLPSIPLVVAFGDNELRRKIASTVGHAFATAVHPTATIGQGVAMGAGSQVLAKVVLNVAAQIGQHTILNTGAIVEHHVQVGSYVHVTPGAVLCGACSIGDGCVVGPGAVVVKGKHVGAGSVLAAGTVVTTDVPPNSRVQGVPGRISQLEEVSWDWS